MDDVASAHDLRRVERTLTKSVDEARSEFVSRVAHVQFELQSFVGNWATAQDLHDVLAREQQSLTRDVDTLARKIRLTGQKIDWLVATSMSPAPPRECHLDDVDATLVELAAAAEHGERFKRHLVSWDVRQSLQADIDRYDQWGEDVDVRYATAVALSETVASTPAGAPTPAHVAAEFRGARDELATLEREGLELTERARIAQRKLALDELVHREHGELIAAGERAWRKLYQRLHATIAAAVDDHALFPPWFCDSLGLLPPRHDADAWLALATEITAYRITYDVTSRLVPLGDPPRGGDTSRRNTWHAELVAALQNLD